MLVREDRELIRTVFLMPREEREGFEELSADSGAPVSEHLRRAAALYLNQKRASGLKPHGQSA